MLHSIIKQLADFITLSAEAFSSSGFYNGKAGAALSLFEASRLLCDEILEEEAAELLQEALLTETTDIGFRNGLSGIGFVLVYLTKNGFVEAKTNELFDKQNQQITNELKKQLDHETTWDFQMIEIGHYLNLLNSIAYQTDRKLLIDKLMKAADQRMEQLFEKHQRTLTIRSRSTLQAYFKVYLAVRCSIQTNTLPEKIHTCYTNLYKQGLLKDDPVIGHYLEQTIKNAISNGITTIINENRKAATIKNLFQVEPLEEDVEMLNFLLSQNYEATAEWLENYFLMQPKEWIEKELTAHIPPHALTAGYGQGIARFLLTLCRYSLLKEGNDTQRMNCLLIP